MLVLSSREDVLDLALDIGITKFYSARDQSFG